MEEAPAKEIVAARLTAAASSGAAVLWGEERARRWCGRSRGSGGAFIGGEGRGGGA
jgi:hypothetical protein